MTEENKQNIEITQTKTDEASLNTGKIKLKPITKKEFERKIKGK